MLDICSTYSSIAHLNIKPYDAPFVTIFISAKDPDEACTKVIQDLIYKIMKIDSSISMRIICQRIKKQAKIDKIYILN
jgi:hypothetical protein